MRSTLTIALIFLMTSWSICQTIDMSQFHGMQPRNIGPAGMSGRVTAIDVVLDDTDHIYIGAAAGGVWESKNNGHTWTPIFDDQKAASIGDIAIYQANPSIIYVGSGEGNPRNSQNSGRGMFKSIDGGATWMHLGLDDTRQIHRVIIHPDNPDVVWAGVSGATWGDSEHRGVYKTIDGGKTWDKILYVDDHTGVSDMVIDPSNPNKIIVGMWEHRRKPWTFKSGGVGSAIYITKDGGANWKKLTEEEGMPKGELGRTGFSFAPSNPSLVYAYIECDATAIFRSTDGGENWNQVSKKGDSNIGGRPFYYADIYVDTQNENRIYSIASEVTVSDDGGKTWGMFAPGNKIHTDHHAWWSHPTDNKHIMIGHDGGLNTSFDRGEMWGFADNLPLAQFYHIRVDNEFPYHVMGGLQDNGSWRGPSRTWFKGGIRNMYWQRLSVGDGFDVVPDPLDPTKGYAMGQAGNLVNYHTASGQLKKIKPSHPTGEHLRFNWNAGIGISPMDQKTIYYGSQYLHKSIDNGKNWNIISPDLTTDDPEKTQFLETGGITYDVTGAENHCSIVSVDPSALDKDVIWVGTDDGNVQVTKDGGANWTNVVSKMPGVAAHAWATQVTASVHDAATAFVVFDDHRRNNWEPYVYMTTDYGVTWKRLADANDIDGYVYCFTQDRVEPNLMFIGSEFGLYVSFDAGANWNKWTEGIPTMPVSDLVIHPREDDLVMGTFGRSIWILDDIRPLREVAKLSADAISAKNLHLFPPPDEHIMIIGESIGYRDGKVGDALYNGENRTSGALLTYWVKDKKGGEVKILIKDSNEKVVRTFYHKAKHGINRTNWRINVDAVRYPNQTEPKTDDRPRAGFYAPSGDYKVQMILGQDTATHSLKIAPDPRLDISTKEIADKQVQISEFNKQVSRLTEVGDDLRQMQEKLTLSKTVLEHAKLENADTTFVLLDSISSKLEKFDAHLFGAKGKQGIYRDPAAIANVVRGVGRLIDHPLSPVTANQNAALENMTTKISETISSWVAIKKETQVSLKSTMSKHPLKLW